MYFVNHLLEKIFYVVKVNLKASKSYMYISIFVNVRNDIKCPFG